MRKRDEKKKEDRLDLKELHVEPKENLSRPQDTTLISTDNLDNILLNFKKVSIGHFGSVCE